MRPSKKRARILKKIENFRRGRPALMFFRRLKKRLFLRTPVYKSEKHNALYFPITKVASTSIVDNLKEAGFKKEKKHETNFEKYGLRFAFVRNPYDRLVSCYKDKIMKPAESGVLAENPNLLYEGMPFKEFVKSINKIPDKKADRHIVSQNKFITDKKGELVPDFIGKFESLEEDYQNIMKKMGIENPPKLPNKRKSKKDTSYRKYYDKETKRLVRERYKKDLDMFGYEF